VRRVGLRAILTLLLLAAAGGATAIAATSKTSRATGTIPTIATSVPGSSVPSSVIRVPPVTTVVTVPPGVTVVPTLTFPTTTTTLTAPTTTATTSTTTTVTSPTTTSSPPPTAPYQPNSPPVRFDVPAVSEFDEPTHVVVSDLPPDQPITLQLAAKDTNWVAWRSSAVFQTDRVGTIDLATSRALRGTYTGKWGMGLFYTMRCLDDCTTYYQFVWPSTGDFTLTALSGSRVLGQTTFTRSFGPPSSLCVLAVGTAQAQALQSVLYYTPSKTQGCQQWKEQPVPGTGPVILAIGGSNESVPFLPAAGFATAGYPAFALTYYGGPTLSQDFKDISLNYFIQALEWLKHKVGANRRIVVFGFSRGSEAALLLAARRPDLVSGVIATSPSSVANQCNCAGSGQPKDALPTWVAARGEPAIPYYTGFNWPRGNKHHKYNPPTANEHGTIPVQDIKGPVFLACGTDDEIWTSCDFSNLIMKALRNSPYVHKLDTVEGAGHFVGTVFPYEPSTGEYRAVANEHGREQIWPDILRFLKQLKQT
jgi:dienelactone hydrolase